VILDCGTHILVTLATTCQILILSPHCYHSDSHNTIKCVLSQQTPPMNLTNAYLPYLQVSIITQINALITGADRLNKLSFKKIEASLH